MCVGLGDGWLMSEKDGVYHRITVLKNSSSLINPRALSRLPGYATVQVSPALSRAASWSSEAAVAPELRV